MIEWFINLSDTNKIAIVVPIVVAVIMGLFGLFKLLFGKKGAPSTQQTKIKASKSKVVTTNKISNLQNQDQSIGNQFQSCIFNINIFDKAIAPDEIKKISAKLKNQENENG